MNGQLGRSFYFNSENKSGADWEVEGAGRGGAGLVRLSWDKDGIRATSGAHALLGEGKLTVCSSYF